MKRTLILTGFLAAVLLFSNCSTPKESDNDFIDENIQSAIVQEKRQVDD
jgi:protein involved in sex pheromone biosynthesis